MVFPAAANLISTTPPDLAALLAAAVLLALDVELHPPRWVCSTPRTVVDAERAPFPSAATRLSAASSNTRVPPLIRPYPSHQRSISEKPPPPPYRESICEFSVAKKHIGLAEREILGLEYGYYVFQNPPCIAFRQVLITRIAGTGTSFSPLPCHTWHGYKVTSAHRVEVEVGADGLSSAPSSEAAAAAPPAGALVSYRTKHARTITTALDVNLAQFESVVRANT
jgi:hypothetical protein